MRKRYIPSTSWTMSVMCVPRMDRLRREKARCSGCSIRLTRSCTRWAKPLRASSSRSNRSTAFRPPANILLFLLFLPVPLAGLALHHHDAGDAGHEELGLDAPLQLDPLRVGDEQVQEGLDLLLGGAGQDGEIADVQVAQGGGEGAEGVHLAAQGPVTVDEGVALDAQGELAALLQELVEHRLQHVQGIAGHRVVQGVEGEALAGHDEPVDHVDGLADLFLLLQGKRGLGLLLLRGRGRSGFRGGLGSALR